MKKLLFLRTCFALLLAFLALSYAEASVTLNSTNFPDNKFRAALEPYAQNGVIDETALTALDVSGKDITDLTGLQLLTGLTTLDISDNTSLATGADITTLRALKTLKASNCNLVSLQGTTGTSGVSQVSGSGLNINFYNAAITYLDISNNPDFYFSTNLKNLTNLETLIMHHCTHFDYWGAPGTYLESLKYVDVSYCTNMDRIYLPVATKLEVLKAAGLPKIKGFISKTSYSSSDQAQYYIALKNGLTTLKWLDVSSCTQLNNIYLPNCANLQHLNAEGTQLIGFSASASISNGIPTTGYIQLKNGLTTLDYLNLADCSSMTSFRAIKDTYNITCLDTLILTNNTHLGWSNHGIEAQTGLRYLDVTDCNISTEGPDYIPNFDNLKSLETLLYGENPNVGYLRITNNSSLQTLDLHDNTGMTMLALVNCSLPRTDITIDDTNCPALTGLKLNNNGYGSVSEALDNATAWGLENIKFLYLEKNSGFTGGPLTLNESDCAGLTGLDLSDNGFTSFNAPSLPDGLTALMIGKNPNMTRLEMHHNPGITTMAADTVMRDGSGLYLLGNTALTYMDISGTAEQPNYFQRIGNNSSLNGVPIDTIKGRYNKFYTFRNLTQVAGGVTEYCTLIKIQDNPTKYKAVYSLTEPQNYNYKAYWPTMAAMPDSASLEQLPNLKYLDLSYCQLKDSVYLHKNPELRYLDVSHNRTIKRYTSSQDKGKAYRESIPANNTFNREFPDYKKYLWLVELTPKYPGRQEAYDQEYYTLDYNDTTGLYILDLLDNNKLEYLDFSYTGIEQTALTHCHVSNARYIWIQDLPELKYLYANYNGMRSMGIGTQYGKKKRDGEVLTDALKSLERLSIIGMRGADVTTMQGSINFLTNTLCTKLHYVNLSYSDFDSIGVYSPHIDTLIVKGNPIHHVNVQTVDNITYIDATECAFKQRGYDPETGNTVGIPATVRQRYYDTSSGQTKEKTITMNGARKGGVYTGAVTTPWSGLRSIRAHNRPELTTVLLDNSNALTEVYCHHDPKLPEIRGFDNLAYSKPAVDSQFGFPTDADSLRLVWVNDNDVFNKLDLSHNVKLNYLHAYNDKALGDALGDDGMCLNNNPELISAWVSNSNLRVFTNNATTHLDTLKIWQNPQLDALNVTANTGLKWFDLRNCMIRDLDMSKNTQLTYFDCSNMDSISAGWHTFNNYGFEMPRQVPTSMSEPGKNSIADLHFGSNALQVVRADNNDLYCMDGLNDNNGLRTLTYSYNHINGIDLSGCPNITEYNCYHNVRGVFMGELAQWKGLDEDKNIITCSMYYLQLVKDAGDALNDNDTYLGHKCGHDTIAGFNSNGYMRQLEEDGFNPEKVISFTVNAAGPYVSTRDSNESNRAPKRADIVYGPDAEIDTDRIYGQVAVIKMYDSERNYIEYLYDDGRPNSSRDGGGSAFGLAWQPPGEPTKVEETPADALGTPIVVSERYYDASGAEHNEPVSGLNIIVRQMSDGSTRTSKEMRK